MRTASTWFRLNTRDFLVFLVLAVSILFGSLQTTTAKGNDNTTKITTLLKNQLKNLQTTKYRVRPLINPHRQDRPPSQKSKRTKVDPEQFRSEVSHDQMPLTLKKMEAYYKCLSRSQNEMRNIYRALVVKVGQTLVLKCHQCFQPGTTNQKRKEVTWKQFRQDGAIMSNIQPGNKYKLTPNRDLQIRPISLEDTGQYFCLRNNTYKAVYQVDVVRQLDYHTIEDNNTTQLFTNEPIPENNLELVSTWSSWTECSQCGTKGIRTKTGICTIRKISKDQPIEPVDIPAFYMFDGGLPCRSSAIPQRIAKLEPIAKRQSEILISACETACPNKPDKTIIKDGQGNVIDIMQPKYYSMQDKPELSPPVKRKVIYRFQGVRAVLKCPTVERMIRWQNGTKPLNFMTLRKKSRGRIFIDGNNWLHIKKTMIYDSSIYSCWKQDKLLSTIKLKVTEGHGKDSGPYITYGLAVIIVGCLVWAMYNIYRGPQNRVAR